MKRAPFFKLLLFFILHSSLLASAVAQTIGEAFYIYRNDGGFNAFFRSEIDSITYSCYDTDSVLYDDIVTQVIVTADSTYRIPLAAIDSVSFVTPETVYRPGVKVIEGEMRSSIISRDDLTLTFRSGTSSSVLPRVGDILVSTTGDEILTSAFVGKVSEVINTGSGIDVVCTNVALTEAFDTYYGCTTNTIEQSVKGDGVKRIIGIKDGVYEGDTIFSPGRQSCDVFNTHNTSVSYNKDDQLSFSFDNARLTLSLTPVITCRAFTIINKSEIYTSVSITGDFTLEEELALSGDFTFNSDFPFFKPRPIPIPEALIDLTFEAGIFGKAQAKVSIDQHWTQKVTSSFFWNWSNRSNAPLKNMKNPPRVVSNTHTGEVAVNGSLGVGFYLTPGVAFIATSDLDIAEVGLRTEFGVSLEGTYVPYKRDVEAAKTSTDLYNQIKDREVGVFGYRDMALQGKLFKWSFSHQVPNDILPIPFNTKEPWGCIRAVPSFSDSKLERYEDGTYFASTKVHGGVEPNRVEPCDVGLALINEDNPDDATYSYTVSDFSSGNADLYASFFDKSKSDKYVAYPLVKYMGMDMLAEPKAEEENDNLCPDDHHPHMIDLGIGTLWACCNVGASAPEQYGNYYAWGETSPKSVYNWDTYQYGYYNYDGDYSHLVNIGSDISGSSYDAARANWGAPWRMPTLAECNALLQCDSEWTTLNGVYGRKFTGPNGGSIFLPAADYRWGGELGIAGSDGVYWSSTLYESDPGSAYFLFFFDSGFTSWTYGRNRGQSVRPVR